MDPAFPWLAAGIFALTSLAVAIGVPITLLSLLAGLGLQR